APATATVPTSGPVASSGSTASGADAQPPDPNSSLGVVTRLSDLNSYRFKMKIEGNGGPLAEAAASFSGLFAGSGASQGLSMEVTGAYIKPDRGQQTMKLGDFIIDLTTIGKQQWSRVFGLLSGPDSADRSVEEYSFAAGIWDSGLIDSF